MFIHVGGKGFGPNSRLQAEIKAKLELTLQRFRARIVRVSAFLEDVNGPKQGLDKSMRLIINIERQPLVVIEDKGETWGSVLDKTAERAAHAVARQLDRLRPKGDRGSRASEVERYLDSKFGYPETN